MSAAAAEPGFARLLSDERLTRRAGGGDERAFAAIFRRYHQSLFRFCLAIVGNPEDAQEALQNTMMKVLRALPGEEREIELKPWLYRIAHNEAIDLLRRRRETRELGVEEVAPGYGLAEDAATRERLRALIADLKELPERQREVLVLRELGGFDFEEIGSALGTSGAVVRQTLYEARQSLRQMEKGREMSCAAVTETLSGGDRRVLRRRDVRAHLRACAGCRAFREELDSRQHDFAVLAPLPAAAAAGMLQGLIGGSHSATGGGFAGTLGGGAAKTIGASAAAKGLATAAVVAAIGVTAADQTGAIHLGLPGERGTKQAAETPGVTEAGSGTAPHGGQAAVAGTGSGSDVGGHHDNASPEVGQRDVTAPAGGTATQNGAVRTYPSDQSEAQSQAPSEVPSWGAGVEHASGHDHVKEHPSAASKGQETAAGNAPDSPEEASGTEKGDGKAKGHGNASHPEPPAKEPPAAPKGSPSKPPAAAPEAEVPTLNPPVEHRGPEAAHGSEKASEKRP